MDKARPNMALQTALRVAQRERGLGWRIVGIEQQSGDGDCLSPRSLLPEGTQQWNVTFRCLVHGQTPSASTTCRVGAWHGERAADITGPCQRQDAVYTYGHAVLRVADEQRQITSLDRVREVLLERAAMPAPLSLGEIIALAQTHAAAYRSALTEQGREVNWADVQAKAESLCDDQFHDPADPGQFVFLLAFSTLFDPALYGKTLARTISDYQSFLPGWVEAHE